MHRNARVILALFTLSWTAWPQPQQARAEYASNFDKLPDRVWVGPELWANRLQDWRIEEGELSCVAAEKNLPMRTVHLLTHSIGEETTSFEIETQIRFANPNAPVVAGFLLGAGASDLDYRAAALVHHAPGPSAGVFCGVDQNGAAVAAPYETKLDIASQAGEASDEIRTLKIAGTLEGDAWDVTVEGGSGATTLEIPREKLLGSVAFAVHSFEPIDGDLSFLSAKIDGYELEINKNRTAGPILSAQHTLHRGVLKLTAQLMPIGQSDNHDCYLQVERDGAWQTVATEPIAAPSYTAIFRVVDWDEGVDTPYRVLYQQRYTDGSREDFAFKGVVRKNPVDKEEIVVAAFTGNHNTRAGVDGQHYSWTTNDLWFPHNDIVNAVQYHKPDLLFFSGDQVYEGASPTRADRSGRPSSYLDYMYKWYLWCWAYRDLARDVQCIAVPDDHDVFQGNIWGQGGRFAKADHDGGYMMPPDWVNMVQRTQCGNLPDPYDAAPADQGITVYYTDLDIGRLGVAVIEDRKFKTGPNNFVPPTKTGRPDHVNDPNFDPQTADLPGAKLLGERQLTFLEDWVQDWRGVNMKTVVSQTGFAGLATHHGAGLQFLLADYDSNGWPQSGRRRALEAFRKGYVFMIGGDQHLATITHHGVDDWGDAGWAFVVPSIANFYPRAWMPSQEPHKKFEGLQPYTGEYRDGFGNPIAVYAHTNPGESTGREPAALHDRMPGYGITRFNVEGRTITMECWPRYVDPSDPSTGDQYAGWPRTISQRDNYARKPWGHLPLIEVRGAEQPVVSIYRAAGDGQMFDAENHVFSIRLSEPSFTAPVFEAGAYAVRITSEDGRTTTLLNVSATEGPARDAAPLVVDLGAAE